MIIKSVTRKQPSFGQLLNYLERGRLDERFRFLHNLYAQGREGIRAEFEHNAQSLKQRRGSVFLYHEILSIKKAQKLSELRQKEILYEIAKNYLLSRAPRSLAYGVLHDDQAEHLHYHLMISGNEAGGSERTRISKAAFAEIKRQLEGWVLERFPELEQTRIMGKAADGEKLSRAGGELKRRTGKTPERDAVKARLLEIFAAAQDQGDFFRRLEQARVRVYVRGQSIGFEDLKTGRKHRLKTLGLEAAFAEVNARISQNETQSTAQASPQAAEAQDQSQSQNQAQAQAKASAEPSSGMSEAAIARARRELEEEARAQQAREARRPATEAQRQAQGRQAQPVEATATVREAEIKAEAEVEVETEVEVKAEVKAEAIREQEAAQKDEAIQAAMERRRREATWWREGQAGTETDSRRKR